MTNDKNVRKYPDTIETRVALLEMCVMNINETLKEIKSEMKEIRLDMNSGFNEIRTEMKEIRADTSKGFIGVRTEMKSDFRWLLTIAAGLFASLGGIIAHGFHWF